MDWQVPHHNGLQPRPKSCINPRNPKKIRPRPPATPRKSPIPAPVGQAFSLTTCSYPLDARPNALCWVLPPSPSTGLPFAAGHPPPRPQVPGRAVAVTRIPTGHNRQRRLATDERIDSAPTLDNSTAFIQVDGISLLSPFDRKAWQRLLKVFHSSLGDLSGAEIEESLVSALKCINPASVTRWRL